MNREQKIKYLQAIQEGKQPMDEFLYNLLTIAELDTLYELLEKYGSIDEDIISPEELRRVEAIERKYDERVNALTKDEMDLIVKDHKYFTMGAEAIKVQQIKDRILID